MAITLIQTATATQTKMPSEKGKEKAGHVVAYVPQLPFELERDIFEWAALAFPSEAPKLCLVARRVQEWLEPVIYRVIVLDYPFKGVDLFMRAISMKPQAFFHKNVKTLCLTASVSFHYAEKALAVCTGVQNLICWSAAPMAGLLPIIHNHPLQKLSIKIETVFPSDAIPDFRHPIFSKVTHLDIVNPHKPRENSYWYGLAELPCLTHLALGDLFYWGKEDICEIVPYLLEKCEGLQALILVCGNEEVRQAVSKEGRGENGLDERLVMLPTFHHPDLYPVYLQGLKNGSSGMWKHASTKTKTCTSNTSSPKLMLLLRGSSSLTPSKLALLLRQIQALCPLVVAIEAPWLHLVKTRTPEHESELANPLTSPGKALSLLLSYGNEDSIDTGLGPNPTTVYVLPRPGSITPWSSKATDIAVLCNLGGHVERLERGVGFIIRTEGSTLLSQAHIDSFAHLLHDRMTQVVQLALPNEDIIFAHHDPRPLRTIDLHTASSSQQDGDSALSLLVQANKNLGLALAPDEINYLVDAYVTGSDPINRDPSDAELFMFAQVNSEHCRHKIFNASWTIDETPQDLSLFQMIRNTERINGLGTISAYSDNAAVLEGHSAPRFSVNETFQYSSQVEEMPILVKVETHNHPTAVSPYPGAATGSGGEIRDEGVGRGSKPKAGLAGFTVSNLLIPGFEQPWETDFARSTTNSDVLR
ncbi:hypothetical protein ONZ45_g19108 [Pleurotus djamor]|nr:hypothetical protein ONZ45_g19108 [Pleurotus djamor]